MHEYYPLLLAGGIIGLISVVLIIAYATVKDKKQTMGFERHMNDGEITRRLMAYAKPYALRFVFVGIVMLFTIAFDIVSPLIIGGIATLVCDILWFFKFFDNFTYLNPELKTFGWLLLLPAALLVLVMFQSYFNIGRFEHEQKQRMKEAEKQRKKDSRRKKHEDMPPPPPPAPER